LTWLELIWADLVKTCWFSIVKFLAYTSVWTSQPIANKSEPPANAAQNWQHETIVKHIGKCQHQQWPQMIYNQICKCQTLCSSAVGRTSPRALPTAHTSTPKYAKTKSWRFPASRIQWQSQKSTYLPNEKVSFVFSLLTDRISQMSNWPLLWSTQTKLAFECQAHTMTFDKNLYRVSKMHESQPHTYLARQWD
jgi:hypothetical protein